MLTVPGFLALALRLGLQDVHGAYQRSALGPVWITIGLGVQAAAIGLIFGNVFNADLTLYFPYIVISLVLWSLITSSLNEASGIFIASERLMRQIEIPPLFPLARLLSRTVVTFFHNLVLVVAVLVVFPKDWTNQFGWVFLGLPLLVGNLYWIVTLIALAGARFRDFGPVVSALLTVIFYATPIIWLPASLPPELVDILLPYNPFFHLMEIVRAPLMGYSAEPISWFVAGLAMVVGNVIAWLAAKRYWWRVVYWL